MFYPVKFSPIPMERIWGGDKLKGLFNINTDRKIGEYWVLSGHPNNASVVKNGRFRGKTLVELTEQYPEAYLGKSPQNRFPLLIKFIEATEDLSVQVHPHDEYAHKYEGDFGKTEAWYILGSKENGEIIYGHTFKDKEEYLSAVKEKRVKNYLKYKSIKKDDCIFVPSQIVHAILSGTTIIEVQQTSDVTYRVYDWDRLDEKGNPRELHVDKAGEVIAFNNDILIEKTIQKSKTILENNKIKHDLLIACKYFIIEKVMLRSGNYQIKLGNAANPDILVVAEGNGILKTNSERKQIILKQGDTVLIPGTIKEYEVVTDTNIKLLRTYY